MTKLTLQDISKIMREIDVCMMTTKTIETSTAASKIRSNLESRPMSNNREVDYDGDSYFFSDDKCSAVKEIAAKNEVNLSYVHEHKLLGKNVYISITGKGELIKDKAIMKKHWVKDVDVWFEQGLDTPGIVLIHVKAERIKYWNGMEEGEVSLGAAKIKAA